MAQGRLHSPVLVCAFCNFRNCCKKLPSLANLLETEELCALAILDPMTEDRKDEP